MGRRRRCLFLPRPRLVAFLFFHESSRLRLQTGTRRAAPRSKGKRRKGPSSPTSETATYPGELRWEEENLAHFFTVAEGEKVPRTEHYSSSQIKPGRIYTVICYQGIVHGGRRGKVVTASLLESIPIGIPPFPPLPPLLPPPVPSRIPVDYRLPNGEEGKGGEGEQIAAVNEKEIQEGGGGRGAAEETDPEKKKTYVRKTYETKNNNRIRVAGDVRHGL